MIKINPFDSEGKNKKRYQQTDIGTSNLFSDMFKDQVIFVTDQKEWYSYNGKNWQPDYDLLRFKLVKQMAEIIINMCFETLKGDQLTEALKYYNRLTTKRFRDTVLKDAESVNCITSNVFNKHKYLFNCQNGTYNIRSKEFKPHTQADFLTDISNVTYDPNAKAPRFEKYLNEVMEGNLQKVTYILKMAGYILTGDTSQECFFVLYGEGTRNGKSTFVGTFAELMGTYSKTINSNSLAKKDNADGKAASGDIARLKQARLVVANEIERGMRLDIGLMKNLTGGDTITARELYKSEIEFIPQFKIVINTNFLPQMTDDTIFKSDRIHAIRFNRHFKPEERNVNLKAELKEELPGIFNLMLDYYYKLKKEGWTMPDESKALIEEYETSSNKAKQYLQQRLVKNTTSDSYYESVKNVFEDFTKWLDTSGYRGKFSKSTFIEDMKRLGIDTYDGSKKTSNGWYNTKWFIGVLFTNKVTGHAMPIATQMTINNEPEISGAELRPLTPDEEDDLPF